MCDSSIQFSVLYHLKWPDCNADYTQIICLYYGETFFLFRLRTKLPIILEKYKNTAITDQSCSK